MSRRGETRHLEPKIMDLLTFLADEPGKVLSKDAIFQAVWQDTFVTEVALTRCISELRTILGDDAKSPQFIETIPKRGYRLIAPVRKTVPSSRIMFPSLVAALVIALVVLAVYFLNGNQSDDFRDKSIAVLPFETLSGEEGNEYFASGITEDVISHLSKIQGIRVISKTTVLKYRNTDRQLPEIARDLGVAMVLEGSVRLEGDKVRISSQLIDARTDLHLWAETYDRSLDDIFEIQTDVAERIAAAMEVRVSNEERQLLSKRPTDDFHAYDAYMKGRNYYQRYRYNDNENAVELFKKAVAIDPDFALAYAGLADAYAQRARTWGVDGNWSDAAVEAAQKAISMDRELPEAHKALGHAYAVQGLLTKALESYRRALALRPQYEAVMANIGVALHTMGRWDEALVWTRRRLQHAPGNVIACTNMAEILSGLGFSDEAKLWRDRALAGEPLYFDAHKQLAYGELFGGDADAAKKRLARILKVNPNNVGTLIVAGETELFSGDREQAKLYFGKAVEASQGTNIYAHLRMGELLWDMGKRERNEAEKHLEFVRGECRARIESGSEGWRQRWLLAVAAAVMDEKQDALDWLEKAVDRGRLYYHWDSNEPAFDGLREQPEFLRLLDQMKTRVDKMAQQVRAQAARGEIRLVPEDPIEFP